MAEICSVCSKEGAKKCSRCKMQFYCSKECQSKDWKVHKKICRMVSKIAAHKKAVGPHRSMDGSNNMKDKMAEMWSGLSRRGLTLSVPEYHKEYRRLYPAEQTNYEKLRSCWMMSQMDDKTVIGDMLIDFREYNSSDLLKRWQYKGRELGDFLCSNPKPGDIFRNRIINKMSGSFHTMRNSPVPSVEFHFGKTYVSIGFVDMFQLLVGSYIQTKDKSGPMIFIGYDRSEVVIARSLIILEMMQRGVCAQSILQVWFSTGWNDKTLKDFHQTMKTLLQGKGSQIEETVKLLITHWMDTKMTGASVLPLWRQTFPEKCFGPLNTLRHEKDRMDYARYIFTGYIFGKRDNDYVHGNVTMFSLPKELEDCYHRQISQSFFFALSLNSFSYSTSLLESVTEKMLQSLKKLIEYIISNRLVCNFLLKNIDFKEQSTLKEIKQLDAKMIDWSNIPDYLSVDDFFKMAKECDGTDTKHFLHYMNWCTKVFGTSLIDYPNKSQVFKILRKEMAEKYDKVKKDRPFLRQDQYLVYFLHAADEMLSAKYRQKFIDYVVDGRNIVVDEATSDEFNPFQMGSCCFFISFAFKK